MTAQPDRATEITAGREMNAATVAARGINGPLHRLGIFDLGIPFSAEAAHVEVCGFRGGVCSEYRGLPASREGGEQRSALEERASVRFVNHGAVRWLHGVWSFRQKNRGNVTVSAASSPNQRVLSR